MNKLKIILANTCILTTVLLLINNWSVGNKGEKSF